MKEFPVSDEVFPFVCENPNCNKKYKYNEFSEVAHKWGYISLTNGKYNFIGLTCPSCNTTTIHKYSLSISDFQDRMKFVSTHYVPFPAKELPDLNQEEAESLYHVPDAIEKLCPVPPVPPECPASPYPKWFDEDCIHNICETDFEKILAYENKNHKQVFPRIICNSSIYTKTDRFLTFIKERNSLTDDIDSLGDRAESLNELLMNIARHSYYGDPEYKDLTIEYTLPNDYGEGFIEAIPALLNEYLQKRNDFDFELSYKTGFLDKYIKQFFYSEGYYRSKRYFDDKAEYEEMFGKRFKYGFKGIDFVDDSDDQEILSHVEVLKRWDKDINILNKFVLSRDLPAYDVTGAWFNPSTSNPQEFSPEEFIYRKSEVEELETRKPWLSIGNSESDEAQPLTGKEARELGQLRTEKKKWDASIEAAVKIGFWAATKEKILIRRIVKDKLYKIDNSIADSTFEKIWKAIPEKKRSKGGKPKKSDKK